MGIMGRQVAQGALFYGFRLDDHVPADHLLRRIDGVLNLGFVREVLAASYSASGRPSIDPELMLRVLLVGYLFGIRSERRLVRVGTPQSRLSLVLSSRSGGPGARPLHLLQEPARPVPRLRSTSRPV
jgi:hypothetical protein